MAKVNKTKFAILGMLSMEPSSGYDIKKKCDTSVAYFWNENYAHIYPVLKDLERDGAVTSTIEQQEGRPSRTVYTITDVGLEMLGNWLVEPVDKVKVRSEFLLKIFFSSSAPKAQVRALIEAEKNKHVEAQENFNRQIQLITMASGLAHHPQKDYWLMALKYGLYSAEAVIKWCDETLPLYQD